MEGKGTLIGMAAAVLVTLALLAVQLAPEIALPRHPLPDSAGTYLNIDSTFNSRH